MKTNMTVGKEWKVILLFVLPIMAGNFLQQLYSIVDGIIVGNFVNERAFAAVATSMPLAMMYLALALGLSVGVGVTISQYYGAKREAELPIAIDTALILLGVCGLFFTIMGAIFSPVLLRNFLTVPDDIVHDSITYLRIFSFGLVFQFVYNGIAATLRAFGDAKAILYFLLIATILSTILTFVFVAIFPWGVAGAAFSTIIAQAVCAIVSYMYLRKKFPFQRANQHWDGVLAAKMIRLGLPIAIQMGVLSVGNGAMFRLVNSFEGTNPGIIAAYGAAIRLDMLVFVPIQSFGMGLANFAGQNIGAGRLDRVRRGLSSTILMSVSLVITLSILLNIFAYQLIAFFGLTDASMSYGVEMIRFLTFFFWLFACNMTLNGLLQGAGDTVTASVGTMVALGTRVLIGYAVVHLGLLGYNAAWVSVPIGWVVASLLVFIRFFKGGWKKKAVAGALAMETSHD